jgi:hypothetical protein
MHDRRGLRARRSLGSSPKRPDRTKPGLGRFGRLIRVVCYFEFQDALGTSPRSDASPPTELGVHTSDDHEPTGVVQEKTLFPNCCPAAVMRRTLLPLARRRSREQKRGGHRPKATARVPNQVCVIAPNDTQPLLLFAAFRTETGASFVDGRASSHQRRPIRRLRRCAASGADLRCTRCRRTGFAGTSRSTTGRRGRAVRPWARCVGLLLFMEAGTWTGDTLAAGVDEKEAPGRVLVALSLPRDCSTFVVRGSHPCRRCIGWRPVRNENYGLVSATSGASDPLL